MDVQQRESCARVHVCTRHFLDDFPFLDEEITLRFTGLHSLSLTELHWVRASSVCQHICFSTASQAPFVVSVEVSHSFTPFSFSFCLVKLWNIFSTNLHKGLLILPLSSENGSKTAHSMFLLPALRADGLHVFTCPKMSSSLSRLCFSKRILNVSLFLKKKSNCLFL